MKRCHILLTTTSAFIECRAYGSVGEPSVKAASALIGCPKSRGSNRLHRQGGTHVGRAQALTA